MPLTPCPRRPASVRPRPLFRALWVCFSILCGLLAPAPGTAQSPAPAAHFVLVPGQQHSLEALAASYQADLAQARQVNGMPAAAVLAEHQMVILPLPAAVALERELVPLAAQAAYPGQTLGMLSRQLGIPGAWLATYNGLALDTRLFPGQPVAVPALVSPQQVVRLGQIRVNYASPFISQGNTGFLVLTVPAGLQPEVTWQDRTLYLSALPAPNLPAHRRFLAPLPVHPLQTAGLWPLHIQYDNHRDITVAGTIDIMIFEPNIFGEGIVHVPDTVAAQLTAEQLAAENQVLQAHWNRISPAPWPLTPWQHPIGAQYPTTSIFGQRRQYISALDFPSFHSGHDFGAPAGVEVRAPAPGTVVLAEELPTKGQAVILDHGQGVLSGYWHLNRHTVQVGETVQAGQAIGHVGNSGVSTGSHLHWELRIQGIPVNPLQLLQGIPAAVAVQP